MPNRNSNNGTEVPQSDAAEITTSSQTIAKPLVGSSLFKIQFFKKSDNGICADDFKNTREVETINLRFLLSLSDLQKFKTP